MTATTHTAPTTTREQRELADPMMAPEPAITCHLTEEDAAYIERLAGELRDWHSGDANTLQDIADAIRATMARQS